MAGRLSYRPRPTLTITFGLSGSGKTARSSALLQADESANTVRIRSDVERKRLFGIAPNGAGGDIYTDDATSKTYKHIARLAEGALTAGWSVIVDAAFLRRAQRDQFRNLAARLNIPFSILACGAPPDELRRRLRARENDASDATVEVLEKQIKWAEELTREEKLAANVDKIATHES
jgi:predicted kinase